MSRDNDKIKEEEKHYVVGMALIRATRLVEGTKSYPCDRCGTDTCISPSAQPVVESGKATPICDECVLAYIEEDKAAGEEVKVGILPQSIKELSDLVKQDLIDKNKKDDEILH